MNMLPNRVILLTSIILVLGERGSFSDKEDPLAVQLHEHWMARVSSHLLYLSQHRGLNNSLNTSDVLSAHGVHSESSFCYLRFRFDGERVKVAEQPFQHHCRLPNLRSSTTLRALVYCNIFTYLVGLKAEETASWRPFDFMMDLTSGSKNYPKLRQAFQVPTLAVASNPLDDTVILVPDFYMCLSLLLGSRLQHLIPRPLIHLARGLAPRYRIDPPPWSQKVPKAVFAGHCYPTIDSSRLCVCVCVMRSMLCARYGAQTSLFIIKTFFKNEGGCITETGLLNAKYCQQCRNCSTGQRVTTAFNYKYQLLVDGHGPAYDASIWKLLSRGVSFQIAPDAEPPSQPVPLYHMFYSPVLRVWEDYIPTTMSELGEAVQWCLNNDEKCSNIAANARNTVIRVLDLKVVLDYMMRILTSLHNWHHT
ncbi:hypothetical protein DUNSADRAFT_8639 [Dunaliella salina]|uniref:Glycosyl transferase CAP10 domain-containing protein n=1 Tax=Dunaliella salina TaxID=3046 RepID=A0ABQ7GJ41_DUNSA|nr:hypothetical protein DUNSADRAFT_8639 [Dunaliella salina]|eukprot:KAF5834631.1 hypothetical protein DUNSADRAFT_8639 [Dunaliella salina]